MIAFGFIECLAFVCTPSVPFLSPATVSHQYRYNTLSPTWNETILVTVTADDMLHLSHVVRFSVYDQDISSKNDYIGRADLLLSQLVAEGQQDEIELKLVPTAKKGETPGEGCAGFLRIKFDCSAIENVRSRAVRDLFGRFDRDGNGRLDITEFQELQSCLSADGQRSSVFNRADENKDGFVDIDELFKCVEDLIPDDVVADYFVKTATTALRFHELGQKGAALTEEQAGRGWLVSVTEWVSRDKCVHRVVLPIGWCFRGLCSAFSLVFMIAQHAFADTALVYMLGAKLTTLLSTTVPLACLRRKP